MRWLGMSVFILSVFLVACGTSALPSASTAASGSGVTAAADWDRIVSASKQEGKVAVIIPPGDGTRAATVEPFEKKYGITVDPLSGSGSTSAARVTSERGAGKYLWDVFVNGVTDPLTTFIPNGALDPVEPALLMPEVADLKNWREGAREYMDKEQMVLVSTRTIYPTLWINPGSIKLDQIKSYKDFLEPSWKGKFVLDDPRRSGPGQALFTLWYLTPELGAGFIRSLASQSPLVLSDYVQEANMVGQGSYAALLGGSDQTLAPMMKKGVPITVVPPQQLKEPPQVAAGATGVSLFKNAPHPNAAKVYLNWLLSKEGQTGFAQSQSSVSSRVDVPIGDLEPWRVPVAGAIKTYGPDVLAVRDKVMALAKEVIQ